LEITKLLVEKARKRYKWQVNAEYAKWSMRWAKKVLWSVNNFTLAEDLTPKFMSKENGASVPIVYQFFKDMYKLELPPEIKVHPTSMSHH
jgi:hypothetical protein